MSEPSVGDRITLPMERSGALARRDPEPQAPAGAGAAIALGFAAGRERILRRPTLLSALLGAALMVVGAVIERRAGSLGAADRALAGTFRLVIPLVTFGVSAEAVGRGLLRDGVWPLARYGLGRAAVAVGVLAASVAACAALGALYAIGSATLAHGAGGLPLAQDALESAWIGALVGGAYAAWFGAGAAFFRGGRGRWLVLFADFVVGGSIGLGGAILPRGNAQSLLGGAAPLHVPQAASSGILGVSVVLLTLLAAYRCRE